MKFILAQFISMIHLFAIIYLIFGWILPIPYLSLHLILIPLTILQWKMNNNQCVLTQIQASIEGEKIKKEVQGNFTRSLLKKIGLELNDQQLFYVIYGLMFLSFSISFSRKYLL